MSLNLLKLIISFSFPPQAPLNAFQSHHLQVLEPLGSPEHHSTHTGLSLHHSHSHSSSNHLYSPTTSLYPPQFHPHHHPHSAHHYPLSAVDENQSYQSPLQPPPHSILQSTYPGPPPPSATPFPTQPHYHHHHHHQLQFQAFSNNHQLIPN